MNNKISKFLNLINNPKFALIIILLFIIIFFLSEGFTGGFDPAFYTFGPTKDVNGNYISFMGIEVKEWKHVIIIYLITFISVLLSIYYNNVLNIKIEAYVFNHAVKHIPFNKIWTYLMLLTDPLIQIILFIIRFYATATLQIQYIIPQIIATYIGEVPFILNWLVGKTFI
jgi:hypothetical protein